MNTIVMKKAALASERSLCHSCYWAHIQKGYRESEEAVYCCFSKFRPVPFKVADCTDYSNRLVPYRWELEKMALLINIDPARKPAGFRSGVASSQEDEEQEDSVSFME